MAKSQKKPAAPEPPIVPRVGDKVTIPRISSSVLEVDQVSRDGSEVTLRRPGTNLQWFRIKASDLTFVDQKSIAALRLMAVSRYVSSRSEVPGGSLIWTSMPSMSFSTALSCSVRCFLVSAMVYSCIIRLAGDSAPEAGGIALTLAVGAAAATEWFALVDQCFSCAPCKASVGQGRQFPELYYGNRDGFV
jgi:hypothetical protein